MDYLPSLSTPLTPPMNNHHLFLIRADQVTQLLAHLTAGIITLVLISSLSGPETGPRAPHESTPAIEAHITLPVDTEMIAATR